ncbi:hypothetical protein KI387_004578 [Taxus chinensis]|uniref:Uncharacterized protein n=1 Tax=Taxus chinensis TaxID=29808 RepID=A0AA38GM75_TAXCH|nr:hypothetical protein KI387_004578 [Taxus chinensis]
MARLKKTGKHKASPVQEPNDYESFNSDTYPFKKNAKRFTNKDVGATQEDDPSPSVRMDLEMKLVTKKTKVYQNQCERFALENLYFTKKNKELLVEIGEITSRQMELEVGVQELELEIKNWETMREVDKKVFATHVAKFNTVLKTHEDLKEVWKKMYMHAKAAIEEKTPGTPTQDNDNK